MSIYKGTEFIAGTPDMSEYMTTTDLLSALYPIGSIYIGTQATCPLAILISGSTWELVAENRALWGSDGTNANTTIAAGLPNITGSTSGIRWNDSSSADGAFNLTSSGGGKGYISGSNGQRGFDFDASRSSSIYGSSDTVQPPAYVVNIWRRTA